MFPFDKFLFRDCCSLVGRRLFIQKHCLLYLPLAGNFHAVFLLISCMIVLLCTEIKVSKRMSFTFHAFFPSKMMMPSYCCEILQAETPASVFWICRDAQLSWNIAEVIYFLLLFPYRWLLVQCYRDIIRGSPDVKWESIKGLENVKRRHAY
jgi:hypothetical protein